MSSAGTQPTIEQPLEQPQVTPRARWIDLGLVLFISFAALILVAVYALFHPQYVASPPEHPALSVAVMLLRDGSALMVLAYVFSRQKRGLGSIGIRFRWSDPFIAVGLMILAAIIVAGLHFLIRGIDNAFGIVPDTRPVANAGWKEHSVTELIHDISSPIFEEVLVRGYLMSELIALGKPIAVAITASVVLQASYHLYYGLGSAVALSGVFLVFAAYFAKSRKLMPVILAHLFWDLTLYFFH
jgi:membrane protease YdiL (CAAX protease family)